MTTDEAAKGRLRDIGLTQLRETNMARRDEWRARDGSAAWTGADWSNEMCGEAGEAANVVKKLRRIETGYKGPGPNENYLRQHLAEELADVLICVDLLGMFYDIDLAPALVHKFNQTSEKQNLATRLPDPDAPARFTWATVPVGHDVPGSGVVIDKSPHVGGFHVTFRRGEGFAEGDEWTGYRLATDKVPTELTSHGLVYWS